MDIKHEVARSLLSIEAVFLRPQEPFTWASGIKSPIYCDNRLILTAPEARDLVEHAIAETVRREYPQAQVLMGTATAGIAHAAIAAHLLGLPMGYVRSSSKDHGRQNRIEGKLVPGQKVVVVEDLISTGGSVLDAVDALREAGAEVLGVVSIFTYGMKKGVERLAAAQVRNVSLTDLDTVASTGAQGTGCVSADGTLYISAHSTQETAWWILRWNYEAFSPVSEDSCLEPYYTRDFPDVQGQASCETLARELGAQYGISVLLFDEAAACAPWDYAFTAEYRVDKTNWALEDLKATLEAFPEGFLTKLRQDWEDLTVCIVDTIQGTAESGSLDSAEGLQFQNGSHFYIALAPKEEDSLKHTLFHEFSHLIDNRVLTKTGAYDNWNDLNPQDFAYSLDLNADMTPYKALLTGPDRVFIDNYAMTFPAEDRARIFECACTSGNEEDFVSPILQAKLQRICTGIRQAFDLEDAPERFLWEQYLTSAQ